MITPLFIFRRKVEWWVSGVTYMIKNTDFNDRNLVSADAKNSKVIHIGKNV